MNPTQRGVPTPVRSSALAAAALVTAQSQIGQEESPRGSNKGPMVDEYLKTVGLRPGYAWCQAFVYWCYGMAAKRNAVANPMVKTAGVYDCWNRTGSNQQKTAIRITKETLLKEQMPILPGDQFVLLLGKGAGHTGIVEKAVWTGKPDNPVVLHTIEGNSNAAGGREGYAVVRRTRSLNEVALKGIIRYL